MDKNEVQQALLDAAGEAANGARQLAEHAGEGLATQGALSSVAQSARTLAEAAKLIGETTAPL
jgi:hypothetical protein